MHLIIITMSAVVPDFDSGIGVHFALAQYHSCVIVKYLGIASIFGLAQTYDTTSGVINDLTSKCVILRSLFAFNDNWLKLEHLPSG
jgi:hypothetical protein